MYAKAAVGQRIAFCRAERGMTQGDLARRSGVALSKIQSFEHGQTDPRLDDMRSIALALQCSIDALVGFPAPDTLGRRLYVAV